MLAPGLVAERPVKRSAAGTGGDSRGPSRDYTAEEEEQVMQRLRDLGYLN